VADSRFESRVSSEKKPTVKEIYDSGLHHPLAAYIAALLLLTALARHLAFLAGFLVIFAAEIVADATITGAWSPVPTDSPWYEVFAIVFVILGDLRYFLLADWFSRPGASLARVLKFVVPISFAIPLLTGVGSRVIAVLAEPRVLFLAYEILLLLLVVALQSRVFGRREAPKAHAAYVRRLSGFVAIQYLGWACADVLILSGHDVGHVLRIVPNVLYYAAFLPFVLAMAPPGALLRAVSDR
jgi:hypothetical protein